MNTLWQQITVAVIVLVAVGYLGRRFWLVLRRKRQLGCSGCGGGCGVKSKPGGLPVVELRPTSRKP